MDLRHDIKNNYSFAVRYIHAKDRLERRLCSQAKRALAIISTSVLKTDDLDVQESSTDGATCAVCIENYRVDEVVRILPCKHRFHKSCIDQGRKSFAHSEYSSLFFCNRKFFD